MTAASRTLIKDEGDLGRTKCMTRKMHNRAIKAKTGKRQASEGQDRIIAKKDMAETIKVWQVCMTVAHGTSKLSHQDAVRTLLQHVKVLCLVTLRWTSSNRGKSDKMEKSRTGATAKESGKYIS